MKARVKATGEIVDGNAMVSFNGDDFYLDELEAIIDETEKIYDELDEVYWANLKHQYAGMAMQGILSNQDYCKLLIDEIKVGSFADDVSRCAKDFATALIEKLKSESNG